MNNYSREQTAANYGKYLDSMLAISTIYFKGIGELSELALGSARETVGELLTASRTAVAAASTQDAAALRSNLAQPMAARFVAESTEYYQIIARSQQEAAKLLEAQFAIGNMRMLMPTDMNAAMEMFSGGVSNLATMNATNLAAATDALSGMSEKLGLRPRKAA